MNIKDLENYLINSGHTKATIKIIKPEIEDCFMQLMKSPVRASYNGNEQFNG
jgi:hypothetical protein